MKRILLTGLLVLWTAFLFAAPRFWVGGGSSSNYTATVPTNWSATSGGSNNASVPTTTDDVTFDGVGASGNTACNFNGNTTILSLTFTAGYTATITGGAVALTVTTFVDNTAHTWGTFSGSMVFATAGCSVTSNGKTFSGAVQTNSATVAITGTWTVTGSITASGTGGVINTGTISTGAGVNSAAAISGTGTITMTGGTWSGSGAVSCNLNLAGNITFSSATTRTFTGATMTYVSGTTTTTGTTMSQNGTATTYNTNGITFNNMTFAGGTITLSSLLTATGTVTFPAGGAIVWAGTAGFTFGTITSAAIVNTAIYTFQHGVTYTITTSMQGFQNSQSRQMWKSDDATLTAIITLQPGAICSLTADFTRIDASNGRRINTFHGVLVGCTNILSYTDYLGGLSSTLLFVQ